MPLDIRSMRDVVQRRLLRGRLLPTGFMLAVMLVSALALLLPLLSPHVGSPAPPDAQVSHPPALAPVVPYDAATEIE